SMISLPGRMRRGPSAGRAALGVSHAVGEDRGLAGHPGVAPPKAGRAEQEAEKPPSDQTPRSGVRKRARAITVWRNPCFAFGACSVLEHLAQRRLADVEVRSPLQMNTVDLLMPYGQLIRA